ncbi:dTDP-4-dehydrorhamnose reductase [Mailhella sp.]
MDCVAHILVTGSNGQLANELRLLLGDSVVYADRHDLDITNEAAVKAFFEEQSFDFVINCAAYTAVDKAEDDFEAADRINRLGPALLAKYGKRIIHMSSDYVFEGLSSRPYTEKDVAKPLSVYGSTKLAGENTVLAEAETAVVIRASWMFSRYGENFVKTVLRLGAENDSLGIVFDQIGTPTYAADLAATIVAMLPQIKAGTKEIYHYSNEGVASWYDFAVAIMRESGLACEVRPIETSEYPTRATRPAYSVLNKAKIRRDFGLTIPHWMDGLKRCIAKLNEQA